MAKLHGTMLATVILLTAVAVVRGTDKCDEASLKECEIYHEMVDYVTEPQHLFEGAVLSGDKTLDIQCGHLSDIVTCVSSSHCEDYMNGSVSRYIDTMNYLCSDDIKPAYPEYIRCAIGDARQNLSACASLDDKHNCEKRTAFYSCTEHKMKALCNSTAAEVYVKAMKTINVDPCTTAAGGSGYHHFAPIWMTSIVLWLMASRWLTYW